VCVAKISSDRDDLRRMRQRRGIAFAERAVCQTKPAHPAGQERWVRIQLCGRKSQSVRSYSLDPLADGTSSAAPLKTTKNSIESADSRSLRSFAPAVPMIKAVQPGPGDYCGSRRKPAVNGPSVQGVLNPEREQLVSPPFSPALFGSSVIS